jgi:peptidoglycan/LPS O-acetylase OafA/YrhL
LSRQILLLLGFVSYPLYLTHENFMIAIIIKLNRVFTVIPSPLLPLLTVIALTTMAYIIANFLETPLRKMLAIRLRSA